MQSQTLLITGGAGFIGSNFVHYYLQNHPEDKIINLDLLTYAGNLSTLKDIENNPQYKFIQGDIRDGQLVNKIMEDVDVVVHFAAESHVDRSIMEPAIFLETNILGTQVLLDAALKHKVKRFHHISTDEVFGALELGSNEKFNEETAYNPHSPYSASKAASDHLVRAYGDTYGLPFTLSNCSNNYGEYHFPEKMIPLAITNLIDDKKVPIYGDGLYVRDWLYVQDHCKGIDLILQNGENAKTYLFGGLYKDVNNLDLIKMIIKIMGKDENAIEYIKDRPGHDRRYSVDFTKTQEALGWQPSVSLEEGLKKTVAWYQNNQNWWRPLKTNNQAYFNKQYDT
ncbi:MAG: dTDP-glucose 4,6-dehydratase [Candidatus Pacebacteria bacterium GW2011_GWF2_38_9]|nr:MAG: dTDP-glucose 4,6-dehydratase, dTDP-glucose 4,6-dehydratase [candidate division TM6 bacterium GW2011_GWF2_28_16]KKQ10219.1 MAG: dTDP-glucose 4,6-dehydratase [Candidatus Pacebacteria bacterium GW2011_GWF1_36_5]KKQ88821.1 MAG: dTDP-glucose 4,6-dehydratase [Candidatus Pacebacteria bacterium GW2011_GWF2_38_9]HAZ73239.1 dTDP-glucose 4,6-dehydratase [Candidatus Paceibacterota bacterium]